MSGALLYVGPLWANDKVVIQKYVFHSGASSNGLDSSNSCGSDSIDFIGMLKTILNSYIDLAESIQVVEVRVSVASYSRY